MDLPGSPYGHVVADSFPREHLWQSGWCTLIIARMWQKQASEPLGFAHIKHSLAKYKNTILSNCFLHIGRGVSKAGAKLSPWNQELPISDQDQIQECYGFQIMFSNLSSLRYRSGRSLLGAPSQLTSYFLPPSIFFLRVIIIPSCWFPIFNKN